MNDLDLHLDVGLSTIKVMSTIVLHSTLNITETVRDETRFQRTINRE